VAQLVQLQPASSSSSGAEDSEAQEEAQRIASGASQQEDLSNGRPPAWGSDPVPCVRAVLRHVLQNYTREAMRKIAVGWLGLCCSSEGVMQCDKQGCMCLHEASSHDEHELTDVMRSAWPRTSSINHACRPPLSTPYPSILHTSKC
jgi:hypothetical protein